MKQRKTESREKATGPGQAPEKKPRFQIVKLEERIAPCYNRNGKFVGQRFHKGYPIYCPV
jgi:hypothetical protein